jgi:hypothetical protein
VGYGRSQFRYRASRLDRPQQGVEIIALPQLLQDGVSFCLGSVLEHALELKKLLPVLLYAAQLL